MIVWGMRPAELVCDAMSKRPAKPHKPVESRHGPGDIAGGAATAGAISGAVVGGITSGPPGAVTGAILGA